MYICVSTISQHVGTALRGRRFKGSLYHIASSSRPAWATSDRVSKTATITTVVGLFRANLIYVF